MKNTIHAFECNCKKCKKQRTKDIIRLQSSIIDLLHKKVSAILEKRLFTSLSLSSRIYQKKQLLKKLQNPD